MTEKKVIENFRNAKSGGHKVKRRKIEKFWLMTKRNFRRKLGFEGPTNYLFLKRASKRLIRLWTQFVCFVQLEVALSKTTRRILKTTFKLTILVLALTSPTALGHLYDQEQEKEQE